MKKFLAMALAASSSFVFGESFKVAPEKYRSWNHVKSMIIFDQKTSPL